MNIKFTNLNVSLKKGGDIKIKESTKGSFTKYCKGKVTQDCIDKAKKSGNKKLIKKAVFAENARKWSRKKQEGGELNPDNLSALEWQKQQALNQQEQIIKNKKASEEIQNQWNPVLNGSVADSYEKYSNIGNLIGGVISNQGNTMYQNYMDEKVKQEKKRIDKLNAEIDEVTAGVKEYMNEALATPLTNGEELLAEPFLSELTLPKTTGYDEAMELTKFLRT